MDNDELSSYISPTERIFADISYLGQGGDENTYGMPRTDPVMRMVDMAADRIASSVRDHLYARHRIMELEQALEDTHREVHQLSMGVLRAGEGAARISKERARQKVVKGYEANHDDLHAKGQLIRAALGYLRISLPDPPGPPAPPSPHPKPKDWPWPGDWKPSLDRVRNLERAGALIAAEIDRIKREEEFGPVEQDWDEIDGELGTKPSPDFDAPRSVKDNPQA